MKKAQWNRRRFVGTTLAGVGALATTSRAARSSRQGWNSFGEVVIETPFARIERLSAGVWAVISTPFKRDGTFGDVTTICNGGIIAGTQGVFIVDTFQRPAGAAWVAQQAEKLTGMRPTHVAMTHFHGDHSGGAAGFQNGADGPQIIATETTRKLVWERLQRPRQRDGAPIPEIRLRYLAPTHVIPDNSKPISIDLGGRAVRLDLRQGHTPSDLVISVEDPAIVFDGDLVWKDIVPNFRDSTPSQLLKHCRELLSEPATVHVPGHGDAARARDLKNYLQLLDEMEAAARREHKAGRDAESAGMEFKPSGALADWLLPDPKQYVYGFEAWYRELG